MLIFIKSIDSCQTIIVAVHNCRSIVDIKAEVARRTYLDINQINLIFKNNVLQNNETVEQCRLENRKTVQVFHYIIY